MKNETIYDAVHERYATAANAKEDHAYGKAVATEFGYSVEELANIPEDANLGLSCGNPFALANLKEGETVCDLGSGAGFDVFLAAKKVGASGKVIGIDVNKDMLKKANQIKEKTQANNVSFVESPITKIALPDGSVECIISNCVINLVPETEKQLVFNEMARILKPGGRVAISDILAKKELPSRVKDNMALYVGCIAGASQVEGYDMYLRTAGFNDSLIVNDKSDLNVYTTAQQDKTVGGAASGCCGPVSTGCCSNGAPSTADEEDAKNIDFNEFAGSYKIYALKP
ncbi:hypothetical protein LTR37_013789 [Vermiconidia calcicola]|uniref:Uncharacterized protein n=1 Tax=Vermiconidia calcicola TaxID=1690605 RepID=A0ACC3MVJ3_9PEZI|nr:hypothetical protein LTR37_013789 [Vermiconidia calcicola]